jgi:hypothetical protein
MVQISLPSTHLFTVAYLENLMEVIENTMEEGEGQTAKSPFAHQRIGDEPDGATEASDIELDELYRYAKC